MSAKKKSKPRTYFVIATIEGERPQSLKSRGFRTIAKARRVSASWNTSDPRRPYVVWVRSGRTWRLLRDDERDTPPTLTERIRQWCARRSQAGITLHDVWDCFGGHHNNTSRAFRRLVTDGVLVRREDGRYTTAKTGR